MNQNHPEHTAKYQYTFSNMSAYRLLQHDLEAILLNLLGRERDLFLLGVNEAITNALEYKSCEAAAVWVSIRHIAPRWLLVRVRGEKKGFDWKLPLAAALKPKEDLTRAELLSERGRGLRVMVATSDRLHYNRRGDEVLLAKRILHRNGASPSPLPCAQMTKF